MRKMFFLIGFCLLVLGQAVAQQTKNVLFIGNSYTEVNNLPQLISQVAESMGDHMTWQSNTPGGCTFMQHCQNQSMTLIRQGGWDAVALQEQSQYPSFPQQQVENEVFPYAKRLVDSVYKYSPCAEPMFYMTWGRRDGDQQNAAAFPVLGTYQGMDSMLYMRYMYMADENDASVCPVGRVWHSLRDEFPDIELYAADGSHPSLAGSYAAACAFYVMLFEKDPSGITYSAGLDDYTARSIRDVVRSVVYKDERQACSLLKLIYWKRVDPSAYYDHVVAGQRGEVHFTAFPDNATSLLWDFGDGETYEGPATETELSHTYQDTGLYQVTLYAMRHCLADTFSLEIYVTEMADTTSHTEGLDMVADARLNVLLYPNPTDGKVSVDVDIPMGEEATMALYAPDGRQIVGDAFLHGGAVPTSESSSMTGRTINVIDLTGFPTGIYRLVIVTPRGIASRAIIRR